MAGEVFPFPDIYHEGVEYPDDIELDYFLARGFRWVLRAINEADSEEEQVALAMAVSERLNEQLEDRELVVRCKDVQVKGVMPRHSFTHRAKQGDSVIITADSIEGGVVDHFVQNRYVDLRGEEPVFRYTIMMILKSPGGYASIVGGGHARQSEGQPVYYGVDLHSADAGDIQIIKDSYDR